MSAADALVRLDVGLLDTATQNGVLSVSAGAGITVGGTAQNPTVANAGVVSLTAGTGVALTGTAQAPVVSTVFAPIASGTITIAPGASGGYSPPIPGITTDSIISVSLTTGLDSGALPEWASVIDNPLGTGNLITVGVFTPAVNPQKYSWVVWKL